VQQAHSLAKITTSKMNKNHIICKDFTSTAGELSEGAASAAFKGSKGLLPKLAANRGIELFHWCPYN
jgi:hypothetical protein